MPTLFSLNDGNLTDSNVFGQTLSSADLFNGTSNINVGTSYGNPNISIYSITSDGSTLSAVAINVNFRAANPTGTLSMMLSSGASYVTETYAISSFTSYDGRNNLISNASQNWQILKLTTPFASTSGSRIRLDFLTSDPNQLSLVGVLTAFEDSKDVIGTFNGTFTQSDSPFLSSPLETSYVFNSSSSNKLNFEGYNDTVFGTGDFTIETWFKINSTATYYPLLMKGIGYNGSPYYPHDWHLFWNDGKIWFTRYTDVESRPSFDYTPTVGVWTHIAICRKNGVLTPYVNGVSLTPQANTVNYFNNTNYGIQIGASVYGGAWWYLNGSVTNARVIAGRALYTKNFTVPSSPLALDSGFTTANYKSPTSPTYVSEMTPFSGVNAEDGSLYFNGTTDYLTTPKSNGFDFPSGTFTIEAWVRFDDLNNHVIASNYLNTGAGWTLQYYDSKFGFYGAGNPPHIIGTTNIQSNIWYHITVAGSPGSYKMFLNGVQEGATYTGALSLAGGALNIGTLGTIIQNYHKGYISNLRIVNGTAVYTSNFAVPTAPLLNIANTSLLLKAPYSPFTYGATNTPVLSSASPFGVGTDSSIRFNGSTTYLTAPYNPTFSFGTGDFTIEAWIYRNDTSAGAIVSRFTAWNSTAGSVAYHIRISSNKLQVFANSTANSVTGATTINANTWYHITVTRQSGTFRLFLNGVLDATWTPTALLMDSTANMTIGSASDNTELFNGHISNLRIVNGTALYTSNFTPSTSSLSAVAGTVFLMKDAYDTRFTTTYSNPFLLGSYGNVNKGLITTTTKNPSTFIEYGTLTKTGSPTLSSASPFGIGTDSSIYFSNSNYITVPSNNLNTDSNDFTVECWFRLTASGGYYTIFSYGDYRNDNGLLCRITNVGSGDMYNNSAFVGNWGAVPLNQWHHLALCRISGSLRLYLNGSLKLTTTINTTSTLRDLYIGASPHTGFLEGLNGNISNFRIVKNTALYTSDFTVPASPLNVLSYTPFLYKHPYDNTYTIKNLHNLHIGGSLNGLTSEARILTASAIEEGNIYIHNGGKLTFPQTNTTINVAGSQGLQITSDGTLEIGTSTNPIPSSVQHNISLLNSQIDAHNGGNMNVYGAYKKPYTYLTADSLSSARTFTVVDTVSTNWSVGDSVVFTPNTFQANSFDVLTLSSFDGDSTFRTTASAAFNHPSVTSLGNVPTVSNLSRNVSIRGNSSSSRGTVRAVDAAKVNITNTQFTNFGIASVNKTGLVVGVNQNGFVTLSGNSFNSDGFGGTTHITTISSKPTIGSVTLRDNVFFRSGGNGVSLSSVSATALTVTGNTLLSSASSGLFFASVSSSGITMSDNTVIGARSNGTLIANSNINGDITGVVNYRNGNSGLVLSASQCGNLTNIVSIHNIGEGIYIDGSVPGLVSNTTFSNITASNNATLGFRLSGNAINHLTPVTLNINRLVANNNLSGGFEGYCISGNLSSLQLNNNGIYGMRTSIGNAPTTIDGITALMNNVASTSAGIGILSGTNYYPILIKDAIVGGLSGSGISLDSTKFSQFNVINSTVSGRSSFNVTASRNVVEGSYLISNTNVSNLPVGTGITNSNYQPEVFKTTGFAFTNMNNASGYNVTYLAAGNRAVDSTLTGNISAANAPSERLTPQSTTLKLRSGSKFVALSAGQSTRISVYMRKSSVANNGVAYNGTSPRLILKRNATMGIASDIVVDQLDTTSEIFLKLSGVSPAVTDTGVLEFYVDCDGTTGWINIDNWSAT